MGPKHVDCEHSREGNGEGGLKVGSSNPVVDLSRNGLGGCGGPSVEDYVFVDESCSA